MHHYPRNVGDILKATMGLTLSERGAYDALLDQYYAHERPLPKERREVYRLAIAATAAERKAVDYVLTRFFTEGADGWHQKRADKEIAAYRDKAEKATKAAGTRWKGHANAYANASPDALRTQSGRNANQNQEPEPYTSGGGGREPPTVSPARPTPHPPRGKIGEARLAVAEAIFPKENNDEANPTRDISGEAERVD